MREHLRHWVLIDLAKFREGIDYHVSRARQIDNRDGTYGLAFDLRSMSPEIIVAASDTMRAAMAAGAMEVVEPLPTAERERVVIHPPQLKDLIAKFGGHDLITPAAWARWDAEQAIWQRCHRDDRCVIYVWPDGSIDNPNELDLTGTPYATATRRR